MVIIAIIALVKRHRRIIREREDLNEEIMMIHWEAQYN